VLTGNGFSTAATFGQRGTTMVGWRSAHRRWTSGPRGAWSSSGPRGGGDRALQGWRRPVLDEALTESRRTRFGIGKLDTWSLEPVRGS
jgi:hypothetical protein